MSWRASAATSSTQRRSWSRGSSTSRLPWRGGSCGRPAVTLGRSCERSGQVQALAHLAGLGRGGPDPALGHFGLIMVARPIEEVRGEGLLSDPAPIRLVGPPIPPLIAGVPMASLSLEQRAAGPRWVIELPGGEVRLADPRPGSCCPICRQTTHGGKWRRATRARRRSSLSRGPAPTIRRWTSAARSPPGR